MIEIRTSTNEKNESETESTVQMDQVYESNSSESEFSYLRDDDHSSVDDVNDSLYPSTSQLPHFPSLKASTSMGGINDKNDFPINSRVPIPIETDLFVGKMLFIIRPSNPEKDDPYWNDKIFKKKKRRVVMQVQGKLKRKPKGALYAGGEISEKMQLSFVTKGMATLLLNLIKKFIKGVHYSFGDNEDREKPHIVAPAYMLFERFIVTKENEQPPKLGEPFFESEESILARRNAKDTMNMWNTKDTYSMECYNMYTDIVSWSIVGLPCHMDLHAFWGNSFLRFVIYENISSENNSKKNKDEKGKKISKRNSRNLHLQKDNNYAFFFQLKHTP